MRYKQRIVQRAITKSADIFEFLKPQEIFKNSENEIKSGKLYQRKTTIANRQKEKNRYIDGNFRTAQPNLFCDIT